MGRNAATMLQWLPTHVHCQAGRTSWDMTHLDRLRTGEGAHCQERQLRGVPTSRAETREECSHEGSGRAPFGVRGPRWRPRWDKGTGMPSRGEEGSLAMMCSHLRDREAEAQRSACPKSTSG